VITHEVHELLWNGQIARTALIALLCHRTADPPPFAGLPRSGFGTGQTLNGRLAGFASRSGIANFDVAIAHDCHPLLTSDHNV
jgi:hypothetical protein